MSWVRGSNTSRMVSIITNLGKLYVLKAMDVPATSGFGEPLSNIFSFADGECVVAMIAPDPVRPDMDDAVCRWDAKDETDQPDLFTNLDEPACQAGPVTHFRGILITKRGQGFRFDYAIFREPTKRMGRRLVILKSDDEVVALKQEDRQLVAVAVDSGNLLVFPVEQIPILSGAAQGVRIIKLPEGARVVALEPVDDNDELSLRTKRNRSKSVRITPILVGKRDTRGKEIAPSGIVEMKRVENGVRQIR